MDTEISSIADLFYCILPNPDSPEGDAILPLRADYIKSIYFTVITMATVGYGDISPQSDYAKIFDCMIMMFTLIVIPQQVGELLDLIRK
jgi:hypothetical protein